MSFKIYLNCKAAKSQLCKNKDASFCPHCGEHLNQVLTKPKKKVLSDLKEPINKEYQRTF
jgi:rRNA maturation endonuclease Nob1